jgi:DNA uptake protein ComE-like DNA-binding protein
MEHRVSKHGLIVLSLLLSAGLAQASGQKADTTAAKPTNSSANSSKATKAGSQPVGGKINAVDINSASKAELKALPGIDDALAAKIIAGRPYPSKAFLVTRNIIPAGSYAEIRKKIIAVQK